MKVEPWKEDPSRIVVYFVAESFADLYPKQRFHWLIQALPYDFVQQLLSGSVWFELAPGERPKDLPYLDEETIAGWTPFLTIQTSGYEQYLGAPAADSCGRLSVVWIEENLSSSLQSQLYALK